MIKKVIFALFILYTICLNTLLVINFSGNTVATAIMSMGITLFLVWVLIGGFLQFRYKKRHFARLTRPRRFPLLWFISFATAMALLEEAITTSITNFAPLYGVPVGDAYITASANYFDVVLFHSVIVFVPMMFTLGLLARRYAISPLTTTSIWGICGILAEVSFAGPQALINAPMWFMVYGLMVYLPSHAFLSLPRKNWSFLIFPLFIVAILLSAVATAWIPAVLDHPSVHFETLKI